MATERQEAQQTGAPEQQAQGQQEIERRPRSSGLTRGVDYPAGPFSMIRRLSADMDRLFDNFFGSSSLLGSGGLRSDWPEASNLSAASLWPEIEVHHTGDKLVVQADMPGLKREEINVEVRDRELCISGERRNETERSEGRYYRTERSYGRFSRIIPLPEGAKADTASATFEGGVLKIEIEAPGGEQPQGRRIEVREGHTH